ncbi:MAG: hypothetical protein MRERV_3c003 [Mycoplasmataceae bacterium RV_VA103A]|nr:MAG: hypothetical protein MRERV_3c003 [Mycoplasmataceae bacterium RV_VA103A]
MLLPYYFILFRALWAILFVIIFIFLLNFKNIFCANFILIFYTNCFLINYSNQWQLVRNPIRIFFTLILLPGKVATSLYKATSAKGRRWFNKSLTYYGFLPAISPNSLCLNGTGAFDILWIVCLPWCFCLYVL